MSSSQYCAIQCPYPIKLPNSIRKICWLTPPEPKDSCLWRLRDGAATSWGRALSRVARQKGPRHDQEGWGSPLVSSNVAGKSLKK